MAIQRVSKTEVKRHFLIANAGKELFRGNDKSISELSDFYAWKFYDLLGMDEEELDYRITDKVRLSRYDSFDWYKGRVSLERMGSWPEMKGLDIRLTTGNIPRVASNVRKACSRGLSLDYESNEERIKRTEAIDKLLLKSASIGKHLDFVSERFPLILLPGGEVRERDHNTWARKDGAPLCDIFDYDIDDGNSRAVAHAMKNFQNPECFLGVYKNQN